jgi:phage/plasmid-associated DNA primase
MWLEEGLNPPPAVVRATEDYLSGEDALGRWIEERCVAGDGREMGTSEAFDDFREWCREENEPKGRDWSQRKFSSEMKDKGLEITRDKATRTKRVFRGLELLIGDEDIAVIRSMQESAEEDFFGIQISFDSDNGDD